MGRKILGKGTEKKRPTFLHLIYPRHSSEHLITHFNYHCYRGYVYSPINSTEVKEEEEDYNTNQTQESAELFKSKFPYFTTTIYVPYNVAIPKGFSREDLSLGKCEVSLKNSKGKKWVVKIVGSNGKQFFSPGWRAFAGDNKIKLYDVCTFELESGKTMGVHIYRN